MQSARLLVVMALVAPGLGLVACGGSTPEPNDVPVAGAAGRSTPRSSLSRQAVEEAVDAGLGAFLQRIQVEPVTRDGAYLGFQLKAVDPAGGWSAYDVQVGDIITHANGKSLEAEVTAFEVFQELRTAQELRLSLIRDGVSRQVVIPILGEPTASADGAATSAEPPTSAASPSAASPSG